jgi:hypothetical protein
MLIAAAFENRNYTGTASRCDLIARSEKNQSKIFSALSAFWR